MNDVDTDECRHSEVETHAAIDGEPRLWACASCHIRFYPACRVCVSVGHRGEAHVDAVEPDHEPPVPLGEKGEVAIRKRAAEWNNDYNPLHHVDGEYPEHHRASMLCEADAVEDRAALLLLLDDAREANDILRAGNLKLRQQVNALVDTFLRGYPDEKARLMAVGRVVDGIRAEQ